MTFSNKQIALTSWKAIANFFGCSEKTARRWEANEGLPIHRHKHLTGSRVYAYQNELEAWFAANKQSPESNQEGHSGRFNIAIIPLDFYCSNDSYNFLPDAICENILSDIALLPSITVVSYSSTRFLAVNKIPLSKLVNEVHLDYLIEGSLRVNRAKMQLTTRLVNAVHQTIEWSKCYEELIVNWHMLRRKVVADLVTSLPFSNIENEVSTPGISNEIPIAWKYIHQARYESLKWTPHSIEQAIHLLKAAQKLVGKSDIVLANLGRVYLQQREAAIDCSSRPLNEAHTILEDLKKSNPNSFSSCTLAGWYYYSAGDLEKAIVSLKQALLFFRMIPIP